MNGTSADERWMRLALSLGQRGLGRVWPNPAVGCVIVQAGRIVGRGWTQPGGRPHAEVHALAQAGARARGATAYVTLEPCAHQGQTGPCAVALAEAGIARLVSATTDPDPRVAGKGHAMLRAAGIEVTTPVLGGEAKEAHQGFFRRVETGRPAVTLKLASSLDGRIATKTGDSRWITGPEARRYVHLLRASHDAILIGRETAQADDPDLTVRGLGLADRSPVRVVLDTRLALPPQGRLARTAADVPTWLCHGPAAPQQALTGWAATGAELVLCETDGVHLDMGSVLYALGDRGITRLFVEGGGQVAASLLRAGFVDRLVLFNAGLTIGADGRPNLGSLGISALADGPRFTRRKLMPLGADVLSEWIPWEA